jgi:hypothetical protein
MELANKEVRLTGVASRGRFWLAPLGGQNAASYPLYTTFPADSGLKLQSHQIASGNFRSGLILGGIADSGACCPNVKRTHRSLALNLRSGRSVSRRRILRIDGPVGKRVRRKNRTLVAQVAVREKNVAGET